MHVIPLASFCKKADAVHVKRSLRVVGIDSELHRPNDLPNGWNMVAPAAVCLVVKEADLDTARAVLEVLRPAAHA